MLNNIQIYSMEHSKYHRSNRSAPAMVISNGFDQQSNHNHSYHHRQLPSPSIQCSAYFISRVDLSNYTDQTLRQTINNVVSGPKSKGLKVKLSLPDEGLIIHNTLDPHQSWMYQNSKLLYFWRDSYYLNTIIVITFNRTSHQAIAPYSASIFRLRGKESVRLFFHRAQRFFAELSSRNSGKTSFEKSRTIDSHRKQSKPPRKKTSPSTHTPLPLTTTDKIFQLHNPRPRSETTLSSDTRTSNSRQFTYHFDEDEKMTTVSNYLPSECVVELVRELKELRSEIASLKLETRFTPVRSTSTSPLMFSPKQRMSASPSEIDAQTQTDFSSIDRETKMDISNEVSRNNKRKNEQSNTIVNKRTLVNSANSAGSDREEDYYPSRTHPASKSSLKSTEKESSSISMDTNLSSGEVVSFRSALVDTITSPETIYENIPFHPNEHLSNKGKSESNSQPEEYHSQLMGLQNPLSLLIPAGVMENKIAAPELLPNNQQYFQQIQFSDHLTNPMFNVDKELLANTIANQFGIDQNSPDLQNLIANQHLFVASKRTFANMIWPITLEEESALCASPTANLIDIYSLDSNSSTTKPILKSKKSSELPSKGRRISWNTAFDQEICD